MRVSWTANATRSGRGRGAAQPPSLEVSFERPRYLVTKRQGELILINTGSKAVTVTQLQLASDAFTRVSATSNDVELAPGQRIDVAVDYGKAICDGGRDEHRAVLTTRDGAGHTIALRPDADASLQLLHTEECNRQAITNAADIAFGPGWQREGTPRNYTFTTTLTVRRKDFDDTITIDSIRGGVIFSLNPAKKNASPVLALTRGEPQASAPVRLHIFRCDPHGMAESKKTYRFPVYVALGGGEAQCVEVEPTGSGRALLERSLSEWANSL